MSKPNERTAALQKLEAAREQLEAAVQDEQRARLAHTDRVNERERATKAYDDARAEFEKHYPSVACRWCGARPGQALGRIDHRRDCPESTRAPVAIPVATPRDEGQS